MIKCERILYSLFIIYVYLDYTNYFSFIGIRTKEILKKKIIKNLLSIIRFQVSRSHSFILLLQVAIYCVVGSFRSIIKIALKNILE
jgi:hypothetical protein